MEKEEVVTHEDYSSDSIIDEIGEDRDDDEFPEDDDVVEY